MIGIFIRINLGYSGGMKLSIIRHAQAVDYVAIGSDGERTLTERGSEQSTSSGRYLRETEQLPEIVFILVGV